MNFAHNNFLKLMISLVLVLLFGKNVSDAYVVKYYTPSSNVKAVHNTPRTNYASNSFSLKTEYIIGILAVPIFFASLGILSLFLYQCALLWRCCCKCCKHSPDPAESDTVFLGDVSEWKRHVKKRRRMLFGMYFVFLTLGVICIHALYYGNQWITDGVSGSISVINFVRTIFNNIADAADKINVDGQDAASRITNATHAFQSNANCSILNINFTDIQNIAGQIKDNSFSLGGLVHPLTDSAGQFNDELNLYAIDYKTKTAFIIYAVVIVLAIIYYLLIYLRWKLGLQLLVGLSELLILIMTIVASGLLVILQVMADICMNPTQLILDQLSGDAYAMVYYYSSCIGNDPIQKHLSAVTDLLNNFPANITADIYDKMNQPQYQNPPYHDAVVQCRAYLAPIDTINVTIADANTQIAKITTSLDCTTIADHWHQFLDTDLCLYDFNGLFLFCLIMYIVAALFFALICVASVLWQYFEFYWLTGNENDDNKWMEAAQPNHHQHIPHAEPSADDDDGDGVIGAGGVDEVNNIQIKSGGGAKKEENIRWETDYARDV